MTSTQTPRPTAPASNVKQGRSGIVHAGKWVRRFGRPDQWIETQACGMGRSQHEYPYPTDQQVTCKRCLAVSA